jgi:hypothetical protein
MRVRKISGGGNYARKYGIYQKYTFNTSGEFNFGTECFILRDCYCPLTGHNPGLLLAFLLNIFT